MAENQELYSDVEKRLSEVMGRKVSVGTISDGSPAIDAKGPIHFEMKAGNSEAESDKIAARLNDAREKSGLNIKDITFLSDEPGKVTMIIDAITLDAKGKASLGSDFAKLEAPEVKAAFQQALNKQQIEQHVGDDGGIPMVIELDKKPENSNIITNNKFGMLAGFGGMMMMLMMGMNPLTVLIGGLLIGAIGNAFDSNGYIGSNLKGGTGESAPRRENSGLEQNIARSTGAPDLQASLTDKSLSSDDLQAFLKSNKSDNAEVTKLGAQLGAGSAVVLTPEASQDNPGAVIVAQRNSKNELSDIQVALKDKVVSVDAKGKNYTDTSADEILKEANASKLVVANDQAVADDLRKLLEGGLQANQTPSVTRANDKTTSRSS